MTTLPLHEILTGCPTCSYQQANPGAEFFLYAMLAMPWLIMAIVGFYFWSRRPQAEAGSEGGGEPPASTGPGGAAPADSR